MVSDSCFREALSIHEPGNNSAHVTYTDLHRRSDPNLVMAGHVVAQPDQYNRLGNVATANNTEEREISDADSDRHHIE